MSATAQAHAWETKVQNGELAEVKHVLTYSTMDSVPQKQGAGGNQTLGQGQNSDSNGKLKTHRSKNM